MPGSFLPERPVLRPSLIRILLFSFFPAVFSGNVQASQTPDLVNSCRNVAAAAEPARRIWLERDLLAYEMHHTLGASSEHLRLYRANLTETCMRAAHNNAVNRRLRVRATRLKPTWLPDCYTTRRARHSAEHTVGKERDR